MTGRCDIKKTKMSHLFIYTKLNEIVVRTLMRTFAPRFGSDSISGFLVVCAIKNN